MLYHKELVSIKMHRRYEPLFPLGNSYPLCAQLITSTRDGKWVSPLRCFYGYKFPTGNGFHPFDAFMDINSLRENQTLFPVTSTRDQ